MTPVIFLGAGPGAADLITLRGRRALEEAGAVLYAGSLVNPDILSCCSRDCLLKDSAGLDLESQVAFMMEARAKGLSVVRLHSGDPSLYGAVREQMRELERRGVPYEVIPGVTCAFAAAAALRTELTMPGEAQSVVITRCPGRTPLPAGQEPSAFAETGATLVFYLSAGHYGELTAELMGKGGLSPDTPAAVVARASWPDERVLRAPLKDIAARAAEAGVCRQALLLVGRALSDPAGDDGASSKLYCRDFSHGYRSSLEDERFEGRVAVLAFSRRGEAKAREIVTGLGAGRAEFLQGGVRESVFRDAWTRFDGVICVGATGIAVRLAAPLLGDKCTDPALVAVDERGRFAVSLAGGHLGGANRLARRTARVTGGQAVISTGTDCESLTAFDEAASREGCRILNAEAILPASRALMEGKDVFFSGPEEIYRKYWAECPNVRRGGWTGGPCVLWDTEKAPEGASQVLFVSSRSLVLGLGCRKGVDPGAFAEEAMAFLQRHGVSPSRLAGIASIDLKRDEPAILSLREKLGVPELFFYPADELSSVPGITQSETVREHTGTGSVSEAAALIAASELGGSPARLTAPKETALQSMTFALARVPHSRGQRPGRKDGGKPGTVTVAGLGSGQPDGITPEALKAVRESGAVAGYTTYLDYIRPLLAGKRVIESGMRGEIERCTKALEAAVRGENVCVVTSGDPGVLAMAGLIYELRFTTKAFASVPVRVVPGVTAASLAAAAVGAPLQNGYALVSLSDLLVPADEVRQNLLAAVRSRLPVTLYNPAGRKRRALLGEALSLFRKERGEDLPCALVRHAGQPEQTVWTGRLGDFPQEDVDMASLVILGSPRSKLRDGVLYEARGYADKYAGRMGK